METLWDGDAIGWEHQGDYKNRGDGVCEWSRDHYEYWTYEPGRFQAIAKQRPLAPHPNEVANYRQYFGEDPPSRFQTWYVVNASR